MEGTSIMSDNPPTLALRAVYPERAQQWYERDQASIARFNERLDELSKVLGSSLLMIRSSYDGIWVRGYEEHNPKRAIPDGWRRERNGHGVVPYLRSHKGKEEQFKLDAYSHKRETLPGLPDLVWGDNKLGTWTIRPINGFWFATITVPLGDRTPEQTRLCDVDTTIWKEVKMSQYWAAVESENANV